MRERRDKRDKKKKFDDKKFPFARKKVCRFCVNKIAVIDYKDFKTLDNFVKDRGKILSSRISGNCARHQRMVSEAMKRARYISLLPYVRV